VEPASDGRCANGLGAMRSVGAVLAVQPPCRDLVRDRCFEIGIAEGATVRCRDRGPTASSWSSSRAEVGC
jgi:hypothetical protein